MSFLPFLLDLLLPLFHLSTCASNPSPCATLGQYDKSAGNKTPTRAFPFFFFWHSFPPLVLCLCSFLTSPFLFGLEQYPTTVPTTTFHSLVSLSFSLSMFQLGLFFARLKLGFMHELEPLYMDRRWPNNE